MHVLHLIAVEASSEEEAIMEAEAAIDGYGEGRVWDWFEVGGRWSGLFGTLECGAPRNVLRYSDDPSQFKESLERCNASQNREFRETVDKIFGRVIGPEEAYDFFGRDLDQNEREEIAQRVNKSNVATGEAFECLRTMNEIPTKNSFPTQPFSSDPWHLGYLLQKLGKQLTREYDFNAYFWDRLEWTTSVTPVQERCKETPDNQYLVALDLHN